MAVKSKETAPSSITNRDGLPGQRRAGGKPHGSHSNEGNDSNRRNKQTSHSTSTSTQENKPHRRHGPSHSHNHGHSRGSGQPELQSQLINSPVFVYETSPTIPHHHNHEHEHEGHTISTAPTTSLSPMSSPSPSIGRGKGLGSRTPGSDNARLWKDKEREQEGKATAITPTKNIVVDRDDNLATLCSVCVEPVVYYCVGSCNHRVVCHVCALRMRVLSSNNACVLCRQELGTVIFTKDMNTLFKDLNLTQKPFDRKLSIYFDSNDLRYEVAKLFQFSCRLCLVDCKTMNTLQEHLKRVHELFMCVLCVNHLSIFTCEQRYYTRRDLARHRRNGDKDDSSHKGHPCCEFCQLHFYGNDQIFEHLRDRHFRCHICHRNGHNAFYADYNEIERHFERDHILCPEQECRDKKYMVYETEIDYRAHIAEEHAQGLSRAQKKAATCVELGFQFEPIPSEVDRLDRQDRDRNRRRGARGDPSNNNSPRETSSREGTPRGPSRSTSSQALDQINPQEYSMDGPPLNGYNSLMMSPSWVSGRAAPQGNMSTAQFPSLSNGVIGPSPVGGLQLVERKKKREGKGGQGQQQQQLSSSRDNTPIGNGRDFSFPSSTTMPSQGGSRLPPVGFGTTVTHKASITKPTSTPTPTPVPSQIRQSTAPPPSKQPIISAAAKVPEAFPSLSKAPMTNVVTPKPPAKPVAPSEMFPALSSVPVKRSNSTKTTSTTPNAFMTSCFATQPATSKQTVSAAEMFPVMRSAKTKVKNKAKQEPPPTVDPASAMFPSLQVSIANIPLGKKTEAATFVPPANYAERQKALATKIKATVGGSEGFATFKNASTEYRTGSITPEEYYVQYMSLLGESTGAQLFYEVVALLPDLEKQKQLMRVHNDVKVLNTQRQQESEVHKVLVLKTQKKTNWSTSNFPTLPTRRTQHYLCPKCRNMIPSSQAMEHNKSHLDAGLPAAHNSWM